VSQSTGGKRMSGCLFGSPLTSPRQMCPFPSTHPPISLTVTTNRDMLASLLTRSFRMFPNSTPQTSHASRMIFTTQPPNHSLTSPSIAPPPSTHPNHIHIHVVLPQIPILVPNTPLKHIPVGTYIITPSSLGNTIKYCSLDQRF
jgi:hypothetical protein